MNRLLLFCFLLVIAATCVLSCPYHDRLKALAAAQRERTARLRRLNLRRDQPETLNLGQSVGHHSSLTSMPTGGKSYSPQSSVSVGNLSPTRHNNRRPSQTRYTGYNSNRGYFVGQNANPERYVYIGNVNTLYRPEKHVKCPNSEYHVCPLGSLCVYEFGTYRCRRRSFRTSCGDGLRRVSISSVQYRCVDINECENSTINNCDQVCRNTHGSFRCDCNPGFTIQRDGSCQDTDECERGMHRCQHECVNTVGSYECLCPEGYNFLRNISKCKDINECLLDNVCLEDEECLNTYGGHECNMPPPCGINYHRSNITGSGSGPCVVDKYTPGSDAPVTISYNRFALHSNYPPYTDVGKLHFTRQPGHKYYLRIQVGSRDFNIIQRSYWNYIVVRTKRRLRGPFVYEAKILVTDFDNTNYGFYSKYARPKVVSRVDLAFVVSAYDF